jgi:hypothetical protein
MTKMFEPKLDEVKRDWEKLNNEELNALYSSQNIIRCDQIKKNQMSEACGMYGDRRGA